MSQKGVLGKLAARARGQIMGVDRGRWPAFGSTATVILPKRYLLATMHSQSATRAGGFFVAAINDALQGLEGLAIPAEDLLLALAGNGTPCSPDQFRQRFAQPMAGRLAGHDSNRVRISLDWWQGKGLMATLESWENNLKQRLTGVDLIGELDLTQEQSEEIGALIHGLIRRSSDFQHATLVLGRSYPCNLAAFLVFQGIYGYNEGDYWSAVCAATGLPASFTSVWGQTFEQITKKLGLSRPFAGHRYVGAILGHGGIPSRSLPDFFAQMLQPSVVRPEWVGLGTSELIDEWLASSAHYAVAKPVLRFLEYGGRVAEDFVDRCRQMARDYVGDGAVPLASDVGLPETVVEQYQAWIDSTGQTKPGQVSGPRFRRPLIMLDPWSYGVYLYLPEQQIPALQSQGKLRWEIDVCSHVRHVPVRVRRVDMDLKTEAVNFPLEAPAPDYVARLYADDQLLEQWRMDGSSVDCPVIVFHPDKRTPVTLSGAKPLPGEVLWVIAAPQVTLRTNPQRDHLVREKLPRLPWAWHDWQGLAIDLAGVHEFIWQVGTRTQPPIPVRDVDDASLPELVGACRVDSLLDPIPLYVGRPPSLRIPWPDTDRSDSSLRRWRVELRHEWEAEPALRASIILGELQGKLHWKDGAVELPLDDPSLLGPAPAGQFRIKVRGPLGNARELRFRMAPHLSLTGHEQVVIPDPHQGAPPVELVVETDAGSELQFLQYEPSYDFELAAEDEDSRYYRIEVPPDRTEAPLRLVRTLGPNRNVYLPFRVPIRRLRWMLVLDPAELARPKWLGQAPTPISLGELEQSEFPYLIVELPEADDPQVWVQLRFLADEEHVVWEGDAPAPPGASRFRRFDLRLACDSLRQSRSALLRAELAVQGLPGHKDVRLPAFSVRQGIFIEEVTAVPQQADDGLHLHLRWQPAVPLNGRFVRFWSQTCPWRNPVSVSLPDDARQEYVAHLASDALTAGKHLVEFIVRDPWLPETKPERPLVSAENVVEVQVGDLEQRLAELVDHKDRDSRSFDERCERFLLQRLIGDSTGATASLQSCWNHRQGASIEQLTFLVQELGIEHQTAKAIQMYLYHPERVRYMLHAYDSGGISQDRLQRYLDQIPRSLLKSPQTCEALLDAPNDRLRLWAAAFLIRECRSVAVHKILSWAEAGELSETETFRLLDSNLAFTTRVLDDMPVTPLVMRLWERLAKARPDTVAIRFVRPGQWVRCQAGWGRIERIEGSSDAHLDVTPVADLTRGYRLHVVLRPGEDSEPVVIDVGLRQVLFTGDATIYHCSVCRCCATRDEGLLYNKHKKIAHQGEVFGFSPVGRSVPQIRKLEFFLNRPPQLWA